MKLAIVGTRTFTDYEFLCWEVNKFSNITEIISGGAKGADKLAEQYAKEHKIPLSIGGVCLEHCDQFLSRLALAVGQGDDQTDLGVRDLAAWTPEAVSYSWSS